MGARDTVIEEYTAQLQACMYQYSRAIYRSIKDLIDPYVATELHLEYRRAVLEQCEQTMERLAPDPPHFAQTPPGPFPGIPPDLPIPAHRPGALPGHPAVLPDHGAGAGRLGGAGGRGCRGRVHRGADRSGRARRRRRALPRDDAEGQAVPAHAAARARLLPVAPAPRALQSRGLAPLVSRGRGDVSFGAASRAWHVTSV